MNRENTVIWNLSDTKIKIYPHIIAVSYIIGFNVKLLIFFIKFVISKNNGFTCGNQKYKIQ